MKKICSLILFGLLASAEVTFAMAVDGADVNPDAPRLPKSRSAGSLRGDGTGPLSRQFSRTNIFQDPNEEETRIGDTETIIRSWSSSLKLSELPDTTAAVPDDQQTTPIILPAIVTEIKPAEHVPSRALGSITEEDDEADEDPRNAAENLLKTALVTSPEDAENRILNDLVTALLENAFPSDAQNGFYNFDEITAELKRIKTIQKQQEYINDLLKQKLYLHVDPVDEDDEGDDD